MGTRTTLTVSDLEKLPPPPENEGKAWELSEGELILVGNAKFAHERVKAKIAKLLTAYILQQSVGEVMVETGFVLNDNTFRIPDVLFASKQALAGTVDDSLARFVPELVVEIVSDTEKPSDVERKLRQYLACGVHEVWQVYLGIQAVSITTQETQRRLYASDTLATSVLPGFETPVAAFFEPVS